MIAFALCMIVSQASEPAIAADERSLKEFVAAGEKYNLDQRLTNEQLRRALADFDQAWGALLPAVTVQGSWTYNQYEARVDFVSSLTPIFGSLLPPEQLAMISANAPAPTVIVPKNQLDASIRVDLPIFDPARWARISASSAARDGAKARSNLSLDMTRKSVIAAYFSYVASLAVKESAYKAIGASEAQLKLIEARRGVGSATELDYMRARAEVASRRQTIADTEQAVATSARMLRTLTGKTPSADIGLPADNLSPEPSFEELERDSEKLPAIVSADADVTAAKRLALSSNLVLIPAVNANFLERFTNATGFQGANNLYSFGLTAAWRLDVPTFQAMRVASAQAESSKLQAEKTRLQSRDQIHSDWQRWNTAMIKIKATATQVEAAQRAAQVARDRYAAGASTQVDVIQAERDLFIAEVQQIQAKTELAVARGSLRISSGRPLEL